MQLSLTEISFLDIKQRIIENINSFSGPIDSYYEDHVIESKHFLINIEDITYGYLSIFDGKMLTQYCLNDDHLSLSNSIFEEIMKKNMFSEIYVSTADKKLLVIALDYYKTIDVQDYIFQVKALHECDGQFKLRIALEQDKVLIEQHHEGFFQNLDTNIYSNELYMGTVNDKLVSFGIVEKSKLLPDIASIGIFSIKQECGNNYGSMTIHRLIEECRKRSITPIAGCFSKNRYSRNAAFKAGMYSNIRLLKIGLEKSITHVST